jgi:D-3-phosphoglycerate dehydrogenase / 2-oxoglutarate reductase
MKTLFIDCNPQFELVFRRVYRTDDPEVDVNNTPFQSADLPRMLDGYGICIDDHSYMPTDVMKECRSLKHVVFCGTGASSYMDVAALADLGITVHTFRGYGDTAVAEHAIALMFACARDVAVSDRRIRGGRWEPLEGVQLLGKTLGVIGLGGIGREVARIGRGIGMNVVGWNRTRHADLGVPLVDLDTLLSTSDVISLNLSLFDETRGFLDAKRVARIKPGAILVNTARGALVDEAALIEALQSGRIRHAGLDVFHAEPLKADHPFARMDNVTLSPHAAFRTLEASMNLLRRALDIVRKIEGHPPVPA